MKRIVISAVGLLLESRRILPTSLGSNGVQFPQGGQSDFDASRCLHLASLGSSSLLSVKSQS
jgi:hypothetical protein